MGKSKVWGDKFDPRIGNRRTCRPTLLGTAALLGLTSASAIAQSRAPQAPMPDGAPAAATPFSDGALSDIVVTAQRRTQSTQAIPYNISVLSPDAIAASGVTNLNDMTRLVPGLTSVDQGASARGGNNDLTLRGLRTGSPGGGATPVEAPGQSTSTLSTYFGETPVFFPMPLYDIERVEVLRGPQGTLYGAGAQAGTIRIIPQRPKFDKFAASLEGTASLTEHSRDVTHGINGALNIPLSNTLALRVVGGARHESGFIDAVDLFLLDANNVPVPSIPGDLTSGPVLAPIERDTNSANQWFGRAALRWQLNSSIEVQLDYLHQNIKSQDSQLSNPGFSGGPFDQTVLVPGDPNPVNNPPFYPNSSVNLRPGGNYRSTAFLKRPYEDNVDLASAVASIDAGFATVTSATSYFDDSSNATTEYNAQFFRPGAGFNYNAYAPYNFYPRLLSITPTSVKSSSFVQELRLVSTSGRFIDYVVGAFYQRQKSSQNSLESLPGYSEYAVAIGQPSFSLIKDGVTGLDQRNVFTDMALFGELTGHISSKWQVTVGARAFKQKFTTNSLYVFPLCGADCAADQADPTGRTPTDASYKTTKVVKKFNTSYDFSNNLKAYATYSEGFRRGGANSLSTTGPFASLPVYQTYAPDTAKNFEVGIKGSLANRRIRFAIDVYRINLDRFQLQTATAAGSFPVTLNGDKARSQGMEAEVQARVADSVRLSFGYAYTDAKVSAAFDRLDYPAYEAPSFGGAGTLVSVLGGGLEKGDRLPGVPRHSVSGSVDWTIDVGDDVLASITPHIDGSYRSSAVGFIDPASVFNWRIPGYFMGNARVTLDMKSGISIDAFLNNFTGEEGFSGGQSTQTFANYSRLRNVARPRTLGLTLRYSTK